ncbi:uncharacterized protein LOC128256052 [Drosophila gunungcola]|uniref:Uncharacterized protein n=1 Tax=Drosophila gunungcola TaxID=103775 RepID=A0A9P9YHV2_9MUSC|nr:uncharacterized protein LOC128256052 [Drosophila gunungcola]KAI8037065.1 hypothetical protein M5D96_010384 [Drosophila gunungcola]
MVINIIYGALEAISNAVYTTVATVWHIEQAVINLMMSTFLFILGLVCHPIMVIPMLLGCYYILRNFWFRRTRMPTTRLESSLDGGDGEPRAGFRYRSFKNHSNLANDSPKEN